MRFNFIYQVGFPQCYFADVDAYAEVDEHGNIEDVFAYCHEEMDFIRLNAQQRDAYVHFINVRHGDDLLEALAEEHGTRFPKPMQPNWSV